MSRPKPQKAPELMAVFSNFNIGVPQLYAHVDRIKAMQLGVEVQDVFDTMQTYLGLDLRQRLQPLRTHLRGDRAGRHAVPLESRRYPEAPGPQFDRRDGAARRSRQHKPNDRAGFGAALQRLPQRRPQRRAGAGLFIRAGASRDRPDTRR